MSGHVQDTLSRCILNPSVASSKPQATACMLHDDMIRPDAPLQAAQTPQRLNDAAPPVIRGLRTPIRLRIRD